MDSIWKKRKQQLQDFRRYLNKENKVKKQEVPDGLYQACPSCNSTIRTLDLMNHYRYVHSVVITSLLMLMHV